jgi:hypothetical protein
MLFWASSATSVFLKVGTNEKEEGQEGGKCLALVLDCGVFGL